LKVYDEKGQIMKSVKLKFVIIVQHEIGGGL